MSRLTVSPVELLASALTVMVRRSARIALKLALVNSEPMPLRASSQLQFGEGFAVSVSVAVSRWKLPSIGTVLVGNEQTAVIPAPLSEIHGWNVGPQIPSVLRSKLSVPP